MSQIYVITNHRFSQQPDEATFSQIFDMCTENGWDVDLAIRAAGIVDRKNNNEIVAVTKEDYIASLIYGN